MSSDTIAAVASAPGAAPCSRAVVRLAGPLDGVADLIEPFPTRRGVSRAVLDLGGAMLPCVVLRYAAPASYTGEDAIELLVPSGFAVVDRVMQRLLACEGVRAAGPGEFSARAYLAGRLTIDRARGIEATIAASSDAQLDAARRMLSGDFGDRARSWADRITTALALVEAGIDFTDQEDVSAIEPDELVRTLGEIAREIEADLGATVGAERDTGLPRVVLVGPPSAGKSTLFNALLGRERVVTAPEPGTTRDAIAEPLTIGAASVELVDLAGLDGTDTDAQRIARDHIRGAELVLLCSDGSTSAPELAAGQMTIRVRTKADQPGLEPPRGAIEVSAITGLGMPPLRAEIERVLAGGTAGEHASYPASVAARLASCVRAVRASAAIADEPLAPAELIAGELRVALDELGAVTGRVDPDTVLGVVFSAFCVGK